jgi:hypothetical protein
MAHTEPSVLGILKVPEAYRKRWPLRRSLLCTEIEGERSARRDAVDGDDDTGWAGRVARTRERQGQRGHEIHTNCAKRRGLRVVGWWDEVSRTRLFVVANGGLVSRVDESRLKGQNQEEYLVLAGLSGWWDVVGFGD